MPTDDKHYLLNGENLTQPIEIQLCQKQENFSEFFLGFLKSILYFKHLPKKYDPHSWYLSADPDSVKYG